MRTIEEIRDRDGYKAVLAPENARDTVEDFASRDVQYLGNGITKSNYYIYKSGKVTNRNNALVQGYKLTTVILASDLAALDGTYINNITGDSGSNTIEIDTEAILQLLTKNIKIYNADFQLISITGIKGGTSSITNNVLPISWEIATATLVLTFNTYPIEADWGLGSKLIFNLYYYEDN